MGASDDDDRSQRTARRVFWIVSIFAALYLAAVGYAAIEYVGRQPSRDPFNGFMLATLTLPTSLVAMVLVPFRSLPAHQRDTYFLLETGLGALMNVGVGYLLTYLLVKLSLRHALDR
jgi:hypothetical protein